MTFEAVDPIQDLKKLIIQNKCEDSHLFFTRYFFKARQGSKFIVNWHHVLIAMIIDSIIKQKAIARNFVINVPPGSSKTEMVVINFIARGLAKNPHAKFLHLSYSQTLASLNSQTARDIVSSDEYQELWPLSIAPDDSAKARWNVMVDGHKAGGVWATTLGGQVTGFRAGRMVPGFQGAILIDDPLKPEDAFSKVARDDANRKLLSTVKSRKANPETPIVVIMQRLAENDPTGFIKAGNLDEQGDWAFINIPALIDEKYIQENKDLFTPEILSMIDGTEQDDDGRFSYWPYKEPLKVLLAMEKGGTKDKDGAAISRLVFSGQYMQNPKPVGGNLIKGDWFPRLKLIPRLKARYVFADTAQKTKEHNDYSVFQCWGEMFDGRIVKLDQIRGKWEAPELKKRALDFWAKHKSMPWEAQQLGALRKMYVEDKSSGTGLIQSLTGKIPIEGIPRSTDKLTRVMDGSPSVESGLVCLLEDDPSNNDFIAECEAFNANMTHEHDDQIDPMLDAIDKLLSNNKLEQWRRLK